MRSSTALIIVLILASAASAAEEKVVRGPFIVTFDLGPSANYSIKNNENIIGNATQVEPGVWNRADTYSFSILGSNNTAELISMTRYENATDATFFKEINLQTLGAMVMGYGTTSGAFAAIDGNLGYLMILQDNKGALIHIAWYWLDRVQVTGSVVSAGRNQVVITGNLTDTEATSLLRTLHVNGGLI